MSLNKIWKIVTSSSIVFAFAMVQYNIKSGVLVVVCELGGKSECLDLIYYAVTEQIYT